MYIFFSTRQKWSEKIALLFKWFGQRLQKLEDVVSSLTGSNIFSVVLCIQKIVKNYKSVHLPD